MFGLVRFLRRRRLARRPFLEEWSAHVEELVPFSRDLPEALRNSFRTLFKTFVWEKHFLRVPSVDEAARALGTGQHVSAQDTVPFVIWCAARCLAGSFEEAFWTTVRGLGDRDTTCAMVGGIVALTCREIPDAWLAAREPLPEGFSYGPERQG